MSGEIPSPHIDISHDEGVAQAVSAVTDHPFDLEALCISRPESLPGVIAIGGFSPDLGCRALGFLWGRHYYSNVGEHSEAALTGLGWKDTNDEGRMQLAFSWVQEVVLRDTSFVLAAPPEGAPAGFAPPSMAATDTGGVIVTGWVERPGSDDGDISYEKRQYLFDSDGELIEAATLECDVR